MVKGAMYSYTCVSTMTKHNRKKSLKSQNSSMRRILIHWKITLLYCTYNSVIPSQVGILNMYECSYYHVVPGSSANEASYPYVLG